MKRRILRYLKHIFATLIVLLTIGISILLYENGSMHYGDNIERMNWNNEGPYVFYKNDSILNLNYIKGNKIDGFSIDSQEFNSKISAKSYFNLDKTEFDFTIDNNIKIPKTNYNDGEKIIAISDIESGYRTFRDFLIHHMVIDKNLHWIFGKGHLVLVGDFVDRGFSTTQVLWFIYKLEQDAKKVGGNVHFILGNHEIKNLQGNYKSASEKYFHVGSILKKQQYEFYNKNSFMGRWMTSKNTLEIINGHLFVHGGIHPELTNFKTNILEINTIVRANYHSASYPKKEKNLEQFLISTQTGPSWYRGYFKDDLTQEKIEKGLDFFNVKAVVVGHTVQGKIKKLYRGKVFGIDVMHPKDYHKNFPNKESEGLLIENEKYYRILSNGKRKEL
ncbi:metallophosphoesterase [uncultured Polaribacter sp.]|uniref:metallophosphoesterase n=1 Tax=uncultured Polaribacter sp. TaxID=174711 RepID=UPI00260E6E26|nr:metallophosphoesterase [uncultured Polaribacter sp.]